MTEPCLNTGSILPMVSVYERRHESHYHQQTINALIDRVFKTVADISQFSKATQHDVKVDFLSEKVLEVGRSR